MDTAEFFHYIFSMAPVAPLAPAPPKENFHTHTYRCKHAQADSPDYARAALAAGMTTLGMSDHTPLPDGWTSSIRMDIEELEGYLQAVRQAEIQTGIQVIPGMECDIDAQYFPFYRDELLAPGRCRYLIGAVHYYRHKGELFYAADIPGWAHLASYTDTLIQGITSGIFSFIAHPDHFAADWDRWDADAKSCSLAISEAAKSAGIPLEINGNGFRKQRVNSMSGPRPPYPWRPFWETAAQCRVEVIANSDAHRPQDIAASLDECAALAQELGLEYGKVRLTEK